MDGLKNGIEGIKREVGVLNDGLKEDMEAMMNVKIERLKEGLEKLLKERYPSGDKAIHKNHDEDKGISITILEIPMWDSRTTIFQI